MAPNQTGSSSSTSKPVNQAANKKLLHNIFFGGTAGVIGQSTVFPLYTVKTRLQTSARGQYRNFLHCFRKIVQHDGVRGLYKGMPPAVIGVFPEKAIKLAMNDYLQATLSSSDGSLSLFRKTMAGAGAGFCQVVATNPMELLMIKLQVQNTAAAKPKSMIHLIRELGLPGLYQGAPATLLRDVPFSMVFFPMRTILEERFADENGVTPLSKVFLAGLLSGSTAATISTPMDVIKTKLQAGDGKPTPVTQAMDKPLKSTISSNTGTKPVPSTSPAPSRSYSSSATSTTPIRYDGIVHCARHTYATGGWRAFFTGVGPRILTISPLFGITILFYDLQRRLTESGKI